MRRGALSGAGGLVLAASLALTAPAAAKDIRIKPHIAADAETPLTPQQQAKLEKALNFDGLSLDTQAPSHAFGTPTLSHPEPLAVSRSGHNDGSSTVTVKKSLPGDWNVNVGTDLNMAAAPTTSYEPDRPLPGKAGDRPSGAAFASLGVTRFATVDARVDAGSDQGQLGATVEHSLPLGSDASLTLHGRTAVSDTLPTTTTAQDGAATSPTLSEEESVNLKFASTGTTLSAGVNRSSTDPITHRTLSADQKLYGPLHVTTAVTDPGEPASNKSITAGFDLSW